MHLKKALLFATALAAGCADREPLPPEPAPPAWVYEPVRVTWHEGPTRARLGRSQAPQRLASLGVVGTAQVPLAKPTPWTVPGDGPARAVIHGYEGVKPAVELIDVDGGTLRWRDVAACGGAVVGVTATTIVCADARGTRGLAVADGKQRWALAHGFVTLSGEHVVVGTGPEVIVLDAEDGSEHARVKLPAPHVAETVLAACGDAGRELFASAQDGSLARIVEGKAGPAVAWTAQVGAIGELDACTGGSIVVDLPDVRAVVAIDRTTGQLTGRVDDVRGRWAARDGSDGLELALPHGIVRAARDLAAMPVLIEPHVVGALIASRGTQRLVRASPWTAVLLDERGARAYLPFAWQGGVLGERAIVAGTWDGSRDHVVHRFAIPPRYPRALRVPPRRGGVNVPAELRDLPASVAVDAATAIAKPDTGKHAVAALALDATTPSTLYAAALEAAPSDDAPSALASADLVTRAWRWQRADGCGPGAPVGLAVAATVIACAARTTNPDVVTRATVRATSRDGAARWEWEGAGVDAIRAAGDLVLVHDADRLHVLDAATGRALGVLASGDGGAVRAALAVVDGTTLLVTYEAGRILVRVPVLDAIAIWSVEVAGVVAGLTPSGAGVLVALDDGDAVRLDLRTASVAAVPGLGLRWDASSELVTGVTIGGPIPAPPRPPAAAPVLRDRFGRIIRPRPVRRPVVRRNFGRNQPPPGAPEGMRLWKPIEPPPPLGDSWQLSLFEQSGAVRARNDYALVGEVQLSPLRGPEGSPLVVAAGAGLRDVLVVDPRTGDPLRRIALPEDAAPGLVFGTIVSGTPVAGAVLAAPLRVVMFDSAK